MPHKRPESVLVIIYTKDAKVLMLERINPEGFWQSVTGSLRKDESAYAAAQRELEEETGLKATLIETKLENSFPIASAWRQRYAPDVTHNHEVVFAVELRKTCQVSLNLNEHKRFCWLPRDEAAAKASSWTNRDAILALVPKIA